MGRVLVGVVVVAVVFTVYTAIDCALTPRSRVRGLPRVLWVLVALVLPVIGGLLWLAIGRAPSRDRRLGPDDDPAFLKQLGSSPAPPPRKTRSSSPIDEELRQYEQELANLDGDADDDGDAGRRRD